MKQIADVELKEVKPLKVYLGNVKPTLKEIMFRESHKLTNISTENRQVHLCNRLKSPSDYPRVIYRTCFTINETC